MQAQPLSLTARSLYAELRDLAMAIGATEAMGPTPGTVVRKALKGREYLYYQYRDLDGRTRQAYLGPDDADTLKLVEQLARRKEDRKADLARLDELRGAFVAAGGMVMEHAPLRVLRAFADAGILRPGQGHALLVGTHAFNALANLLGVRWPTAIQTQDIDLAGEADVDLAISRPDAPAPNVLEQLGMGFIPVPRLDAREPSTSFRVRGQELRVDLLTPMKGKPSDRAVHVPALDTVARPLRFLDYLIEDPVPVVIVGRKNQVLVNVPAPERFALHKLLVAESRPAADATRAAKDRTQAVQLLEVLKEEAPDGLPRARAALVQQGKGWAGKLERSLQKTERDHPEVTAWVQGQ